MILTSLQRDPLDQLIESRVRVLEVSHFIHMLGPRRGRDLANRLVGRGTLDRYRIEWRPLLAPLEGPLVEWTPGDPWPDTGSLAWRCQNRCGDPRPGTFFVLSRRAIRVFGGHALGRVKNPAQAGHDAGVTSVYLGLAASRPEDAACWLGEDVYAGKRLPGQKQPDAMLFQGGRFTRAIEFIGCSYTNNRINALIRDCEARGLSVELW